MPWDYDDDHDDEFNREFRKWAGDFIPEEFFRQIEEMMRRIQEEIGQGRALDMDSIKRMMEDPHGLNPFVFGFSIRVGPDGKPIIQRFGSRPPAITGETPRSHVIEPLVDVIEEPEEVIVVAELPGVEKDQIKVRIKGKKLIIDVDNPHRPYHKQIDLPADVKKDESRSSLRNGVLEVRLKKER
ncbi:MAG: archaeal heat shock protein Hsp20 [Candidatus Thorarchaeota archaeon]